MWCSSRFRDVSRLHAPPSIGPEARSDRDVLDRAAPGLEVFVEADQGDGEAFLGVGGQPVPYGLQRALLGSNAFTHGERRIEARRGLRRLGGVSGVQALAQRLVGMAEPSLGIVGFKLEP